MLDFLKAASRARKRKVVLVEIDRLLHLHKYAAAEQQLKVVIEDEDRRGKISVERVDSRLKMADIQRRQALVLRGDPAGGDGAYFRGAEITCRAAIELAARLPTSEAYVDCLDTLIQIFADSGNYPALEKTAQEATRIGASLAHPDPLRMAQRVLQLGLARHENRSFPEAAITLDRALRLFETHYGPESPQMAGVLGRVGRIFRAQFRHQQAQECLRRALRIYEGISGSDSPEAMRELQQLAGSYQDSGDLESAAQQYERALMLKMRKLGVDNLPQVAEMQYSLASLHAGWGNLGRARELLEDSIGAFRREGGPRLAAAHEILAEVHQSSAHHALAVQQLENATKVWEKCGPPHQGELIRNLHIRAELLDQMKRKTEAGYLRERATALESAPAPSPSRR